jgi:pimeloyl-ACP methyl ester carboxylesterase
MALQVPTSDGRLLEVLTAGPEDGFPLVFHHGTPGAAVADREADDAAAERGLRTIRYSRPGYGGSSPRPQGAETARVADDVDDVLAILDHLGHGDFVTMGWSGGGPRSLACAALAPERCRAATCGVGIAPYTEFEGDLLAGMAQENIEELGAALEGPEPLARYLEGWTSIFSVSAEQVAESLGGLAPPVDRAALTGERAENAAAVFRHAGEQGTVGWQHDDLALLRPWGFSVKDIGVPVAVWQGTEDTMVPFAHAEWLVANIPGVRAHLVEGEGHISLKAQMPRILDDLRDLAGLG